MTLIQLEINVSFPQGPFVLRRYMWSQAKGRGHKLVRWDVHLLSSCIGCTQMLSDCQLPLDRTD